jgi:hypothetical protein
MSKTATYSLIASYTVPSATANYTFSSIPITFTDLVLVVSAATSSIADLDIQVGNGSVDTGSSYSRTWLQGNGSAASSGRGSNENSTRVNTGNGGYLETTLGTSIQTISFLDYSNTSTYKTLLTRPGNAAGGVSAIVHLWRSTAAINTIKLIPTSNFITGSTLKLYGIQAGNA